MCLAIPGRIIKMQNDIAIIDYGSEIRQAKVIEGDYKTGDSVIVQAQIVVEKVSAEQMQNWLTLIKENAA